MSARTFVAEGVRQHGQDERDRDDADRHVDPEDGLPVPALDDGAADQRADRDAEPGDAAPDADRERAAASARPSRRAARARAA